MALVIYFSYALQFYVPIQFIQRLLKKTGTTKYENVIQISARTILVTLSVAVAVAFPYLELVISFVGAIFLSTLGLFIPAVIETIYRWDRGLGKFNYVLIKNVIIAIFAPIALFSSSYVSILGLLKESSSENDAM